MDVWSRTSGRPKQQARVRPASRRSTRPTPPVAERDSDLHDSDRGADYTGDEPRDEQRVQGRRASAHGGS